VTRQIAIAAVVAAVLLVALLGVLVWNSEHHDHTAYTSELSPAVAVPGTGSGWPSIAGTAVPYGLACQEDETVFWVGVDALGCVHADAVVEVLGK